jgi:hypothetical protein
MRSPVTARSLSIAIVLCVVGLFLWHRGRTDASPSSTSNAGQPASAGVTGGTSPPREAGAELDRLQRQVAALESNVSAMREDAASAAPADGGEAPLAGLSEEEELERRGREEARVFAQIGQAFAGLPQDQAWSDAISQRVRDHLHEHPLVKSSIAALECRASACRIEIGLQDGADLGEIRDSFRHALIDVMGTGASKRDPSGKLVLYLAKDPQTLGI